MNKKKEVHIHKYKRVVIGKNGYTVYRCVLPNCPHYIRKELAENRLCLCNRCNEPMLLDKFAMQFVEPHCVNCTDKKDSEVVEKISELVNLMENK